MNNRIQEAIIKDNTTENNAIASLLETLPKELYHLIFQHLELSDAARLARTSKKLKNLIENYQFEKKDGPKSYKDIQHEIILEKDHLNTARTKLQDLEDSINKKINAENCFNHSRTRTGSNLVGTGVGLTGLILMMVYGYNSIPVVVGTGTMTLIGLISFSEILFSKCCTIDNKGFSKMLLISKCIRFFRAKQEDEIPPLKREIQQSEDHLRAIITLK